MERDDCVYRREGETLKDIAIITRVGKPVCFKIIGIENDHSGPYAILSRREAQKECIRNYLSGLICGDIIPSKVTHTENFGAFVDIGCGIPSLLSIDSISVSRISHPKDRLSVGMNISTVIKAIDLQNGRIFVSLRELLGTWEENAAEFKIGSTVSGIIRSVEKYGIFVELAPNLAGLAELRDTDSFSFTPEAIIGRRAAVYIKSIIPEKMKVKLVLIDCGDAPRTPTLPKYYIDLSQTKHIDRWRYSPSACERLVESVFDRI
jgi:small subunit ribosomal protein S1